MKGYVFQSIKLKSKVENNLESSIQIFDDILMTYEI